MLLKMIPEVLFWSLYTQEHDANSSACAYTYIHTYTHAHTNTHKFITHTYTQYTHIRTSHTRTHIRANTHLLAHLCWQRKTELLAFFPFLSKPCSFPNISHFLSYSHQGNPWKYPCCFSPSHLYLVNHQSTLVCLFRFRLESFRSEHVPIVLIQSTAA